MEFRPEYGRPPPEFYRGADYPDYKDFGEPANHRSHDYLDIAQQRARSHSRLDPDYVPSDFPTYQRTLDKTIRYSSNLLINAFWISSIKLLGVSYEGENSFRK